MSYKEKLLDSSESIIVTIDGGSASGKGTLAKLLASKYNLFYLPTSLFYRKLAYNILQKGISNDKVEIIKLSEEKFDLQDDPALYSQEISDMASKIAVIPEVRENLLEPQRDYLKQHKRIILEGRDTGTIISPKADLKIFMEADLDMRAKRRMEQFGGETIQEVKSSLMERDNRDMNRNIAPLKKADDAISIDNSGKSLEEIVESLLK